MRLLSWTGLSIWSSALCITCLAGSPVELDSHHVLKLLERQKDEEDDNDKKPSSTTRPASKQSATSTVKKGESTKTSTATRTASATTMKTESTRTSSPTSSRSQTTTKSSSKSASSASLTSASSSSISTSSSVSVSTSSSVSISTSSSAVSADSAQPTAILAPQPQSARSVNIGGIVAGVVLGAAVVIGMAWIAIAKWQENKRRREQFQDAESKRGFAGGHADGQHSSSHDSLLLGRKPTRESSALRLKALSPLSRAHSYVSSLKDRHRSQIPQDALPPLGSEHDAGLPQLPQAGHQFSTPLGSHPNIAEMPSPRGAMPPAGLQAGRPLQRKPLSRIDFTNAQASPRAYQQSPPAELPG